MSAYSRIGYALGCLAAAPVAFLLQIIRTVKALTEDQPDSTPASDAATGTMVVIAAQMKDGTYRYVIDPFPCEQTWTGK